MEIQTSIPGLDTLIGSTVAQRLIDSEIPLPEGRFAASVLSVSAQLQVEESACGEQSVHTSGRLSLQLLCQSDSGDPFGFSSSSGFTHEIAMEGVQEGMQAMVTGQLLECRCVAENGRLRLNAVLELAARVTAALTTPLVTGIAGGAGLETRMAQIEKRRRVLLGEHTLRVREEIAAPNVSRIFLYSGAAQMRELSYSGNSVSADGGLYVSVLTGASDGQLSYLTQILSFTDVFEAAYAPDAWATATVEQLSVTAADESFGVADVEALIHMRLYGVECGETMILTDAYDENAAFTCVQTELTGLKCLGAAQKRFSLRESVQIPSHLPEAYRPIWATAIPAATGVCEQDGKLCADAMLFVSVLYQCDGGMLHSFTEDIPVQMVFDCDFVPDAVVTLNCLSVQASGSGRTPELQFTIEGCAERYAAYPVRATAEVVAGGEKPPYQGVIVYCADAGDTLWSIGKRFLVPLSRLSEWNGPLTEPLAEGQQILVIR